jgi:hypothetical protein
MFTLKIRREVYERDGATLPTLFDQTDVFLPADRVTVNSTIQPDGRLGVIDSFGSHVDDFTGYTFHKAMTSTTAAPSSEHEPARLIHVVHNGDEHWYLASLAWLLGPDGRTIERVAP